MSALISAVAGLIISSVLVTLSQSTVLISANIVIFGILAGGILGTWLGSQTFLQRRYTSFLGLDFLPTTQQVFQVTENAEKDLVQSKGLLSRARHAGAARVRTNPFLRAIAGLRYFVTWAWTQHRIGTFITLAITGTYIGLRFINNPYVAAFTGLFTFAFTAFAFTCAVTVAIETSTQRTETLENPEDLSTTKEKYL
jgi:hypothetical protein